ncbi:MAG: sulfite exporter TauE/SafE family protein [Dehalococcoidia bacterium]
MLAAIGPLILVLAGVFSMLGLGGATVYNPVMVWFGYDFKTVVVPTGLLLNGLTAASASWTFWRAKLVDVGIALPLIVGTTAGAPLGAYVTTLMESDWLLAVFCVFVVVAGLRMLLIAGQAEPEAVRGTVAQRAAVGGGIGIGIGFISGLLGVGGGILIVPLLILMGYPTKIAAASTAFAVVFSSASGFAGHAASGHYDIALMVVTAVAVIIGSQVGARLMVGVMKPRWIRQGFGILLLAIAATLVWGLL